MRAITRPDVVYNVAGVVTHELINRYRVAILNNENNGTATSHVEIETDVKAVTWFDGALGVMRLAVEIVIDLVLRERNKLPIDIHLSQRRIIVGSDLVNVTLWQIRI